MGVASEKEVVEKLLGASYDAEAKARNTDPAILRELNEIKEREIEKDQMLRTNFIRDEFGKIQSKFNLSDSDLTAFAVSLRDQNVDIFSSNIRPVYL